MAIEEQKYSAGFWRQLSRATYLLQVLEEGLQPLGHLDIGAALDDVLHHGGLEEEHAEADVDADRLVVDLLHLKSGGERIKTGGEGG